MLVSIIPLILSAIFCASMDVVDQKFFISIFNKIKNKSWRLWFNENKGWLNKYIDRDVAKGRVKWNILGIKLNKPVQLTDSWHFFKMLMICFFVLAVIFEGYFSLWYNVKHFDKIILTYAIKYACYGILWNLTFSLFYNKILLKK